MQFYFQSGFLCILVINLDVMEEHIVYRKLKTEDLPYLKALIHVYEEVFEMESFPLPGEDYLRALLQRDGLIFLVGILEEKVVGGLTAHVLPSVYDETAEIYIYDLAVRPVFQRRGIGRQLLSALSDYGKAQRYREIFVQADLVDQHALDFYQATGGQAESVVHFTYSLV